MKSATSKDPVDVRQGDRRALTYRVLTRSLLIAIAAGAVLYAAYYFANTADSVPPAPATQAAPK